MKTYLSTPGARLAVLILVGTLITFLTIRLALEQPKMSVAIGPGTKLVSSQGHIEVLDLDLTQEPGEIENPKQFRQFFERQKLISTIFSAPVFIASAGVAKQIELLKRNISDLPLLFWIPLVVGFSSFVIGAWIWTLRPRDLACLLYALSGASIFLAAISSSIYTTRDFFLPYDTFRILQSTNTTSAYFFGSSFLSLFLIYPTKLRLWKKLSFLQAVIFLIWTLAILLDSIPDESLSISVMVIVYLFLILAAVVFQLKGTRKNPMARASLTWLGLSVLIGAGAFIGFTTVPSIIGIKNLEQGYSFLFFLITYLGLAAGLMKFRLFEVGNWAFRFLFYAVGAAGLVLLDAALIYFLQMDRLPALGFSLLIVGFLYLPLRDLLQRRFRKNVSLELHTLISEALHVTFAPTEQLRRQRWESLITKLFDPLEIEKSQNIIHKVEIEDNGLTLLIPAVANASALKISYPWAGQGLFSLQSKQIAEQVCSLIQQAETNREAYDRGVSEERLRVARDLHDDVGARLLTGLYLADEKTRPTLQGALADIRSIVRGISGEKTPLQHIVADLRYETAQRMSVAGIELKWPILEIDENLVLDYRSQKALISAVRETSSNVLKHSEASRLYVNLEIVEATVTLTIADNGKGFLTTVETSTNKGFGLRNLQQRFEEIQGTCSFESSESQGVSIRFSLTADQNTID